MAPAPPVPPAARVKGVHVDTVVDGPVGRHGSLGGESLEAKEAPRAGRVELADAARGARGGARARGGGREAGVAWRDEREQKEESKGEEEEARPGGKDQHPEDATQ